MAQPYKTSLTNTLRIGNGKEMMGSMSLMTLPLLWCWKRPTESYLAEITLVQWSVHQLKTFEVYFFESCSWSNSINCYYLYQAHSKMDAATSSQHCVAVGSVTWSQRQLTKMCQDHERKTEMERKWETCIEMQGFGYSGRICQKSTETIGASLLSYPKNRTWKKSVGRRTLSCETKIIRNLNPKSNKKAYRLNMVEFWSGMSKRNVWTEIPCWQWTWKYPDYILITSLYIDITSHIISSLHITAILREISEIIVIYIYI